MFIILYIFIAKWIYYCMINSHTQTATKHVEPPIHASFNGQFQHQPPHLHGSFTFISIEDR